MPEAPTDWMEETIAEFHVRLKNNKGSKKRLSAVKRKRDRREKRQNGECNPTHYFASSIAATILCLKRSKLRQMQPSRRRATRPTQ
ncbi:hypothetical protein N7522_000128 [Penicillium canescens]|nr:hypothetical protein N7522_000128 [Penicillium canescens]